MSNLKDLQQDEYYYRPQSRSVDKLDELPELDDSSDDWDDDRHNDPRHE